MAMNYTQQITRIGLGKEKEKEFYKYGMNYEKMNEMKNNNKL